MKFAAHSSVSRKLGASLFVVAGLCTSATLCQREGCGNRYQERHIIGGPLQTYTAVLREPTDDFPRSGHRPHGKDLPTDY